MNRTLWSGLLALSLAGSAYAAVPSADHSGPC